jgi:RHS repeat-associated protein
MSINGKVFDRKLLADGRTLVFTTPMGRNWTMVLDTHGRVIEGTIPGLGKATSAYTPDHGQLGTVTREANGQVRAFTRTYYPAGAGVGTAGKLASITDPLGRTATTDSYDRAGRALGQTFPGGRSVGFAYDANGNLVELAPPPITPQFGATNTLQAEHLFGHSPIDQVVSYAVRDAASPNALLASTAYDHTKDRMSKAIHRPEGDLVTFTSSNGRLDNVGLPGGEQVHLDYDSVTGHILSISGPTAEVLSFTYNGTLVTDLTWTGQVSGVVHLDYDNDFLPVIETAVGVPLHFGYDDDGMLVCANVAQAVDCQGGLSIAYKPGTILPETITLQPSGPGVVPVVASNAYNGFGELTDHVAQRGGQALYEVHDTHDDAGRVLTRIEHVRNADQSLAVHGYVYSYDPAGRLSDVVVDGVTTNHYDYDANGNRLRRSVEMQGVITSEELGSYDVQDRQQGYTGRTFQYTESGRLLSATGASGTTQYTYDALGNLRQVVLPGSPPKTIDYVVDGGGRRVGKKIDGKLVKAWLYADSLRVAAEIDYDANQSPVSVKRFIYGIQPNVPDVMIQDGVRYRILSDPLGSPRVVVSDAGQIVARTDYDEYGRVLLDTNPGLLPFGYAGGLSDPDTGLVRFGARDYDPATGRWTARDPIGFAGGDSNLYAYVGDDPINHLDVSGYDRFAIARRVVNGGIRLIRQITRSEAITHLKRGGDVATDNGKAAMELAKDASTACGGNGKAIPHPAHKKGELPHWHPANAKGGSDGMPHIYNVHDLFDSLFELFSPPMIPGTFDYGAWGSQRITS